MTQLNSGDLTNATRDVSTVFKTLIQQSPTILSLIKTGTTATNDKIEWIDDQLTKKSWTLNVGGGSSVGTTLLVLDDATGLRVGDILRFENATTKASIGGNLLIKVVSVDSSTDVTVIRPFGGTTDATIPDDANVYLVSRQGADNSPVLDNTHEGVASFNYVQTFDTTRQVGLRAQATSSYDFYNDIITQEKIALNELAYEMAGSAIFGVPVANSGATSGMMGGLLHYIEQPGGNVNPVGGGISSADLNETIKQIRSDGGGQGGLVIIAHYDQIQKISAFDNANIQILRADQASGRYVSSFQSDSSSGLLTLVSTWDMPRDKVIIGDPSTTTLRALAGDTLRSFPAQNEGDRFLARRVSGSFSLEVKNALQSWGVLTALTV